MFFYSSPVQAVHIGEGQGLSLLRMKIYWLVFLQHRGKFAFPQRENYKYIMRNWFSTHTDAERWRRETHPWSVLHNTYSRRHFVAERDSVENLWIAEARCLKICQPVILAMSQEHENYRHGETAKIRVSRFPSPKSLHQKWVNWRRTTSADSILFRNLRNNFQMTPKRVSIPWHCSWIVKITIKAEPRKLFTAVPRVHSFTRIVCADIYGLGDSILAVSLPQYRCRLVRESHYIFHNGKLLPMVIVMQVVLSVFYVVCTESHTSEGLRTFHFSRKSI